MKSIRLTAVLWVSAIAILSLILGQQAVYGEGTETLGPPGIDIAVGSGFVAAGTGLIDQPGEINVTIPQGADVVQALLYWEGEMETEVAGDDTIIVNGQEVAGDLIGGPAHFFTNAYSSSFRADITDLGIVTEGANTLHVEGLSYTKANNGAGLFVIYDDGTGAAEIAVRDGLDLAYIHFPEPRKSTVKQSFQFEPADEDRVAELLFFASSVEDGQPRPNSIEITIDGVTTVVSDALKSQDGMEWDTLVLPVDIPAGASGLSVQVFSRDDLGSGYLPASLAWIAGGFSLQKKSGDWEGLTPGFWKQEHHFEFWTNYGPSDDYETVFGVDASFEKDLLGALKQGGGGEKALGRHAVAGLLNAASPDINYFYSEAEVLSIVQDAYATGAFEEAKDLLEDQNELGTGGKKKGIWCGAYLETTATLSMGAGGGVDLLLVAGQDSGGREYLVLGSLTGAEPGTPLPGSVHLPLNWDAFTVLTLRLANTQVFSNFMGELDEEGEATARFQTGPLPPLFAGMAFRFAFVLIHPLEEVCDWAVTVTVVP